MKNSEHFLTSRGKYLEALLITEQGLPHEKIIGIVTPIDIMKGD